MIPMNRTSLAGHARRVALALLAALALGCYHATAPSPSDVIGRYTADVLIFDDPNLGNATDVLNWVGGHLSIELRADGTTVGELLGQEHLFGGPAQGPIPMTGTWSLERNVVRFSQPGSDTFMRVVPFTFRSGRLEADHMVGNRRVFAILGRR